MSSFTRVVRDTATLPSPRIADTFRRSLSSPIVSAVSAPNSRFKHDFSTIPVHSPPRGGSSQVSQDDSEPRLSVEQLWAAVESAPIGKILLAQVPKKPKVKWGATTDGFHGEWNGKSIILNESERKTLSDNEWKQVIALELGNAANDATFQAIFKQADVDPPARDDFVDSIERVEFQTRLAIIAAYNAGEFCDPAVKGCKPLFDSAVTDFEVYRKDPRGRSHRESYGVMWDQNYKDKFNKLHAAGK